MHNQGIHVKYDTVHTVRMFYDKERCVRTGTCTLWRQLYMYRVRYRTIRTRTGMCHAYEWYRMFWFKITILQCEIHTEFILRTHATSRQQSLHTCHDVAFTGLPVPRYRTSSGRNVGTVIIMHLPSCVGVFLTFETKIYTAPIKLVLEPLVTSNQLHRNLR